MAQLCIQATGLKRAIFPAPLLPAIGILRMMKLAGIKTPLDINILHRFREDVNVSLAKMVENLTITPRDFEIGLRQALRDWNKN